MTLVGGSIHSCLYRGEVFHKRFRPQRHSLKYQVFTLFVDLSELPSLANRCRWFSHNRFNIFSFFDTDMGENNSELLTDYVHRKLVEAGITETPEKIYLSCYPRIFGYSFNPLSLFYCFDSSGKPIGIVHEVHNTFGERHCYVLRCSNSAVGSEDRVEEQWIIQSAGKELFVSPFAHMGMRYTFRVNVPSDRQVITIRTHDLEDNDHLLITAGYSATRIKWTDKNLLLLLMRIPSMVCKVIVGIHWEALKLYLKKVPLFKHQPKVTDVGH